LSIRFGQRDETALKESVRASFVLIFFDNLLQTHKCTGSSVFHAALFNQNFRKGDYHKDH
ncbi:hypothetical protein, partial [Hominenteromicrobium sp.]|uniref:hypothetical protein n=1 Tax=Hominenteromicrobium sp. TaxID=3073581 RepID=UPI003A954455